MVTVYLRNDLEHVAIKNLLDVVKYFFQMQLIYSTRHYNIHLQIFSTLNR